MTITDDTTRSAADEVGAVHTAARDAARRQAEREATARRVEKLNTASVRRVIEPDTDMAGSIGDGTACT